MEENLKPINMFDASEEEEEVVQTMPEIKGYFGTPVLSNKVARNQVNTWLDKKKVKQKKRDDFEENIEDLVSGFETGQLILNDDNSISMNLIFPIGEIKTLTFKPRITTADKRPYMRKVKTGDVRGTIVATGCALTGQATGIIERLDTEDFDLLSAISLFFF